MLERGNLVAVCLLTYNHKEIVEDTIRSILNQTLAEFEFVISDDCSTDGTWEVIQRLASQVNWIRAIRTPRNLGMAGNANYAVSQISAPYFAILHHDDIYRNDLLERWLHVMERHQDVGFVFNGYQIGPNGKIDYHLASERTDGNLFLTKYLLKGWGCPVRGTAMIRRSCWDELGGMREEFGMIADVDLWMRLSARWAVGYVAEPLIITRWQRPADYPAPYVKFSWFRRRLLYDIHARNVRDYYNSRTLRGRLEWIKFRLRVSVDRLKWLIHAFVRRRNEILLTSDEGSSPYELSSVKMICKTILMLSSSRV